MAGKRITGEGAFVVSIEGGNAAVRTYGEAATAQVD